MSSHQAPIILIDIPNLMEGRLSTFEAYEEWIHKRLHAIDACCHELWKQAAHDKVAFSLDYLPEAFHDVFRNRGYKIIISSPDQTQTMVLKKLSKLDDYILQNHAKQQCLNGQRNFLIVSADRDHEEIAYELKAFAPTIVYTQWSTQFTVAPYSFFTRRSLQDFQSHALPQSPYEVHHNACPDKYSENDSENNPKNSNQSHAHTPSYFLKIIGEQQTPYTVPIHHGFLVGRPSRTQGVNPDLSLQKWDHTNRYSRKVGQLFRMGSHWVFYRHIHASLSKAKISLIDTAQNQYMIEPGMSAIMLAQHTILSLDDIGLQIQVVHA